MGSVTHTPKSGEVLTGTEYEADPHTIALDASDIPTHSHVGEDISSGTVADARLASTIARDSEVTTAVSDHVAAPDPHTGYRLEADNHTHASSGAQGGQIAYSALTGTPTVPPADADYLVGTANGSLSGEIVVGTTPGGELGGTWASPTVDTTHSGTSHAGVISTHEAASDPHTGYRLESADHTHATSGLQGGQVAYSALTGYTSLTSVVAPATATTSISAATYADVTGLSTGALAAGTWLLIATVVGSIVNAHALMHVAITHSDNTVQREASQAIPASGSANVASNGSVTVVAIVTGGATYKVRAARGNTTLTGTWVAMDGAGVGVTNNLTDNSDKGSHIVALRLA